MIKAVDRYFSKFMFKRNEEGQMLLYPWGFSKEALCVTNAQKIKILRYSYAYAIVMFAIALCLSVLLRNDSVSLEQFRLLAVFGVIFAQILWWLGFECIGKFCVVYRDDSPRRSGLMYIAIVFYIVANALPIRLMLHYSEHYSFLILCLISSHLILFFLLQLKFLFSKGYYFTNKEGALS